MESAENNDHGLGSVERLSCHSRGDVLAPRTPRAGLDAGDSGNGFGSRNCGVLTGQTGRATKLHEASQQERRYAYWTAIGNTPVGPSASRESRLARRSATAKVQGIPAPPAALADFRGGGPFPSRSSKKIPFQDRGCIFSKAPIVQVVAFRLVFGAVLMVPPATWSSSSAA